MSSHVGIGPYSSRRFGVCHVQGRTLIDFTSWDVFEVGRSRSVVDAVHREVELEGLGGTSTRFLGGYSPALHSAEVCWASLLGVERAVLVSSRNQALFSVLTQRLRPGDEILTYLGGSAPIAELAELTGASFIPIRGAGLAKAFRELGPKSLGQTRFFFLEVGNFWGQSDLDYSSLIDLLAAEGVELIADETFSIGVLGHAGGGLFDHIGIPNGNLVGIAGLDAVVGVPSLAIIYGRRAIVDGVLESSTVLKSEPPPPPIVAAASEAVCRELQLVGVQRVELLSRVQTFREALEGLSAPSGLGQHGSSVFFRLPSLKAGWRLQQALIREGYLCGVFPSTVERDPSCLIQFIVSVFHSEQVLQGLAQVLSRILRLDGDG
jgi:8-amino-7-oxononanoate synthase